VLRPGTGLVLTMAGSVMQFSPSAFDHFAD
jgi:hypothetical protein